MTNTSDPDGHLPIEFVVLSLPDHGDAVVNTDGAVIYTPDPGYVGLDDGLTFQIVDDLGLVSLTYTVSFDVLPGRPVASDRIFYVDWETNLVLNASQGLGLGASDPDGDTPLSFEVTVEPNMGTLFVTGATGALTYIPDGSTFGEDAIGRYIVRDSRGFASATEYKLVFKIASLAPTLSPSKSPTGHPSTSPTLNPTKNPTTSPTKNPTLSPTAAPSQSPTVSPTKNPSTSPTQNPTLSPTTSPTETPLLNALEMANWQNIYDSTNGNTWLACGSRDGPCTACNNVAGGQVIQCEEFATTRRRLDDQGRELLPAQGLELRITKIQLRNVGMNGVLSVSALNGFSALTNLDLSSAQGVSGENLITFSAVERLVSGERCVNVDVCQINGVFCDLGETAIPCPEDGVLQGTEAPEKLSDAVIIGAAVGGGVVVIMAFAAILYVRSNQKREERKRKKRRERRRRERDEYGYEMDPYSGAPSSRGKSRGGGGGRSGRGKTRSGSRRSARRSGGASGGRSSSRGSSSGRRSKSKRSSSKKRKTLKKNYRPSKTAGNSVWQEAYDYNSGSAYYVNQQTGEFSWTNPEVGGGSGGAPPPGSPPQAASGPPVAPSRGAPQVAQPVVAGASPWEEVYDSQSDQVYYVNSNTGEFSWTRM